jgi:hypothetical protein
VDVTLVLSAATRAGHDARRSIVVGIATPVRLMVALLVAIWCACTILVAITALEYGYDTRTRLLSLGALVVLAATMVAAGFFGRRSARREGSNLGLLVAVGLLLGLLWTVEIAINNVATPPVPQRDAIDNLFWAAVAVGVFAVAVSASWRDGRVASGVAAGLWSGTASGLVACCTALVLIVFGMTLITHDPVNIAEWAARGAGSEAPAMASYYAFETMAGALMHLLVLGILMGALLGAAGGVAGKLAALLHAGRRAP